MKHLLTTALALSLLSGTAVMAQPNTRDRNDQNDNRGDQKNNGGGVLVLGGLLIGASLYQKR
jgi:hypothetical protein